MNNELLEIIKLARQKLKALDTESAEPTNIDQVKSLQQQLLNSNIIGKPELEKHLQVKLKQAEAAAPINSATNRELELAFLYEYIKESYD